MKSTQIMVLALAVAAAGGAGYLALNITGQKPEAPAPQVVERKLPTRDVLVAAMPIPVGESLTLERLKWQEWPESGLTEGLVVSEENADEILEEYAAKIARVTILEGEPVRLERIVTSDRGYMSAILASGKRAVAVRVSALTASGGFVLPNDHVDLKAIRMSKDGIGVETILSNVRVLAVDQLIEEGPDGSKSVIGDTATLELTAEQADQVLRAQGEQAENIIKLNLVLRSIEDADEAQDANDAKTATRQFQMIRAGKKRLVTARN